MKKDKKLRRARRKLTIRNKIRGTETKPRITIFKSNTNLYAQVVNDKKGMTICACSTLEKEIALKGKCNKAAAEKIGEVLAKRAIEKGITEVVFDRNGYQFHGVVKELADSCRKNGLKF